MLFIKSYAWNIIMNYHSLVKTVVICLVTYCVFITVGSYSSILFVNHWPYGMKVAVVQPIAMVTSTFILILLCELFFRDSKISDLMQIKKIPRYYVLISILVSLLLSCGYQWLDMIFHYSAVSVWQDNLLHSAGKLQLLLLLSIIIMNPIFEEILFRGVLLSGMSNSGISPAFSCVITSVIWALLHFQYHSSVMIILFLIGVVLAVMRVYSRTLFSPLIIHIIFNASQMFFYYNFS